MATSLRETIEAAAAESAAAEAAPTGADAGSPESSAAEGQASEREGDGSPGSAGAQEQDGPKGEAKGAKTQPRDDRGQFAPVAEAALNQDQAAQAAETAPPEGTSRVPHSLPAALKAKWSELPEEWRSAYLTREDDINAFRAQQQQKAERLNRFDDVIAPHRQRLALSGVDDVTWIRNLAAAEQALTDNPTAGIAYLARIYGADLRQVVAQLNGGQPAQPGQVPQPQPMTPDLQNLMARFQTLEQTVTQQQQSAEQQRQAELRAEIERFANDPANVYFNDVKDDIAALLHSGRAADLKSAYEMAVWANPETRAILQQQVQAQAGAADREAQERAKATAAARAAGSVTGAPGAGGGPLPGGADPANLRATIAAAYQASAGRV